MALRPLTAEEQRVLDELSAPAVGRPREDVPHELAQTLLDWLVEGRTLADWCRLPGHPKRDTVRRWCERDAEFARAYAQAKDMQADAIADECVRIADTQLVAEEETEETDEDGNVTRKVKRLDALGHRRLQIETRWRVLRAIAPSRYGDTQRVAVGGDDSAPPIRLTEVQRAEKVRTLLAVVAARVSPPPQEIEDP